MRRTLGALVIVTLVAGCAATEVSPEPGAASPMADPTAAVTPTPTQEPPPSPTPMPTASAVPRALFGTWRTTLGGQPLSLGITESTYRIVRGSNAADGSVRVDGDQIEFFGSTLCDGTGTYRWTITDGSLSFFPLEEPCPGRAEALLVRYADYAPPGGG